MRADRLWRATAVMTAGTAVSRATGVLRVAAMAYALGVSGTRLADTYNLANTTPNIVYELVLGGVFTAVLVPVVVALRRDPKQDAAPLVTMSLLALAGLSAAALVLAPLIVRAYTFRIADPALRRAQTELATYLLRWFAPQIFFYGLAAIGDALLRARGRFGPPKLTPALNNLAVCATFLLYARLFGEHGLDLSRGARMLLGAGTTAGVAIQALALLPYLRGARWRTSFRVDDSVRRVVRMSGYVFAYVAVNQIGLWVVLALANGVRGGVTSYQVAFMLFLLPHSLFAVSVVDALLPDLASSALDADLAGFRASLQTGLRNVAYVLLPAAAGIVVLGGELTRIIVSHGAATPRDAAMVAGVLRAFAAGLVFFSAFQLLRAGFNALEDTRTPAAMNAVSVAVWIAASVPFFSAAGVRGLAYAHALSYLVGTVLLGWRLGSRVGGLGLAGLAGPVVRSAAAAAVMAAGVWALARGLPGDLIRIAVCVPLGAAAYLATTSVAGSTEPRRLLDAIRGRRRN